MTKFNLKHVYKSQQFDLELLNIIFNVADKMKDDLSAKKIRYVDALKGKIMVSLFYESSTRTRFPFESAAGKYILDMEKIKLMKKRASLYILCHAFMRFLRKWTGIPELNISIRLKTVCMFEWLYYTCF